MKDSGREGRRQMCRIYAAVGWLAACPEYNHKTKAIPKKDCPVLVGATF
ncbi:hypothetical protein IJ102_00870 [Candidatus Saccharibacteria bacterium]|nr:hypothetical protein [Candidatus Saccharibacteria bacterium]